MTGGYAGSFADPRSRLPLGSTATGGAHPLLFPIREGKSLLIHIMPPAFFWDGAARIESAERRC